MNEAANSIPPSTSNASVPENKIKKTFKIFKDSWKSFSKKQKFQLIAVFALVLGLPAIFGGVYYISNPRQAKTSKAYTSNEGTLLAVQFDDFKTHQSRTEYYLQTTDNKVQRLNVQGSLNIQPGSKIRVNGTVNPKNPLQLDVPTNSGNIEVLSNTASNSTNQAVIGTKRVATILMNFSDTSNKSPNVQDAKINFINRVQPFYKENSFGKLTVTGDVYGWYTFPPLDPNCDFVCMTQKAIDLADPDINYNNYDQIVVSYYSHLGGQANSSTVGAWFSWNTNEGIKNFPVAHIDSEIYTNSTDNDYIRALADTLNHELGHSFGVWHANGWDCGATTLGNNCKSLDYDDFWDLMGDSLSENLIAHFGGYHKELFGWFAPSNVQEVTLSGTYKIYPIEIASNYPQILKIRRGASEWYYLENRVKFGFDSNLPASAVNGLIIRIAPTLIGTGDTHLLDSTPNSQSGTWDFADAGWAYGKTFRDIDNSIEITPLSKTNNILSVKIVFTNSPTPTPSPKPTCVPRPTCPKGADCMLALPPGGWCLPTPTPTFKPAPTLTPIPSVRPVPTSTPKPTPTPTPTSTKTPTPHPLPT